VNSKPWYQSRTLQLNLLAALFLAIEANFHLVQPLLPVNVYASAAFALAVMNTVLRVLTTASLTMQATSSQS
jgi:hypothetical protein